jgi:4-hydroxybenzoate polyprenyltransferase
VHGGCAVTKISERQDAMTPRYEENEIENVTATAIHSPTTTSPASLPAKLALFAGDIKVSHTVFAMPWAVLSAFLAAGGWPRPGQLLLIVCCMVTSRTVAMSANRLLDAGIDALNPRTARRALPSGGLSRAFVVAIVAACSLAFVASTAGFLAYGNALPLMLSAPVLLFLCAYPLLKRFTRLCHYYLGAALALAPLCAWIALRGDIALAPGIMALAVLTWTAGFDILYACQDYDCDVRDGVFSLPAKLGIANALWIARITHACSAALLVALGLLTPAFGVIYFTGAGAAIALLIVEHALVRADDLSKVGLAFFTINGVIALLLGAAGVVDVFV